MRKELATILEKHRPKLVESIHLSQGSLWEEMRSKELVTVRVETKMKNGHDEFEQVGLLLDFLLKGNDDVYYRFCDCLRKAGMGDVVSDYLTPGSGANDYTRGIQAMD